MWPQRSLGEDPDSDCWGASAGHPRRNDCRDPRTPAVSVSVMDRTLIALPPPGPQTPDRAGIAGRPSEVGDAPVWYGYRLTTHSSSRGRPSTLASPVLI